jgi:hypothetical protein
MNEKKEIKVFPITFEVYAYDAQEVEELRSAIVDFIATNAQRKVPILAGKAAEGIRNWGKNPFVKNKIIQFFEE